MSHSYTEALAASIVYFNGDDLAASVFVDKYALRDDDDQLLERTPDDMHRRLAKEFARIEKRKFGDKALTEDEVFELLEHFKYIVPQGGSLYGIGNPRPISLSNCFLCEAPVDSYAGIMYVDEQIVNISKRRGGVGVDISNLRPSGATTHNSSKTSTGVVSFAKRYSQSIREVGQHGRRGALLLSLSVHHPDVIGFAQCKADKTQVTGCNISVRLTDEFMQAVADDTMYEQRWPVDDNIPEISREVRARDVWDAITQNAHAHAEPGLLFWDTICKENPADCYEEFKTEGVNPCSEINLSPLDACRLLLLNALGHVNRPFTQEATFDWVRFYAHAKIAQRLMDDLVDLELEKLQQIIDKIKSDPEPEYIKCRELTMWQKVYSMCEKGRRTGTGLTAIGDALAALGIQYGTQEAIDFVERLTRTIKFACYESSVDMAEQLGAFDGYMSHKENDNPFIQRIANEQCEVGNKVVSGAKLVKRMAKFGRRNISCLTMSPAGSVSLLTQTTSGIEPLFKVSSKRRKKGNPGDQNFQSHFVDATGDHWMEFTVFHPQVKKWMEVTGEADITKSPWYGHCAEDLNSQLRLELQAAAQRNIDNAISSTINLPAETTVEEIQAIYESAWVLGLKGVTVYRKGSRDGVIIDLDNSQSQDTIKKRPRTIPCEIHHTTVKGQSYFVLVGLLEGKPYEVFAGKNGFISKNTKTGTITRKRKDFYVAKFDGSDDELSPITAATNEMEEVVTRLTSLALRSGADMHRVVQQLEKVGERQELHSFARGVARVLKKYIPDGTAEDEPCSQCGAAMIRQEGCVLCLGCGHSKCL